MPIATTTEATLGTERSGDDRRVRRVLVVEDHPVARLGIVSLIDDEVDFEVCGEAGSVAEALRLLAVTEPDVVLLDLGLPDGNGLDCLIDMKRRWPAVRALVVSSYDASVHAERARRAGAADFVCKHEVADRLVEAMRHVLNGRGAP